MFNNKFWLIIAVTLFSVLCCLGETKIRKEDKIAYVAQTVTEEIETCPWNDTTVFHQYRQDVTHNIPCAIYNEAVKQGKKDYAILMVAISIYETGWYESNLSTKYNNFGGMKGNEDWLHFNTQEEGVEAFVNMLSKYYIDQGLDEPYKMQNKYAGGSTTWAGKVEATVNLLNNL